MLHGWIREFDLVLRGVNSMGKTKTIDLSRGWEKVKKGWYKFSKNPLSITGGAIMLIIVCLAIFAPFVAPYPEHAGKFVNFDEASLPPSLKYLFGTDVFGRDILTHRTDPGTRETA